MFYYGGLHAPLHAVRPGFLLEFSAIRHGLGKGKQNRARAFGHHQFATFLVGIATTKGCVWTIVAASGSLQNQKSHHETRHIMRHPTRGTSISTPQRPPVDISRVTNIDMRRPACRTSPFLQPHVLVSQNFLQLPHDAMSSQQEEICIIYDHLAHMRSLNRR